MSLRLLSLNAWGGRLHDPLMRYLSEADPDVLCLQEVTRTADVRSDWLVYRDGSLELPQRANLYADVKALLPDHEAVFAPAARGLLDDGERQVPSEFGLATFVRRTLPIIGQQVRFIHDAFSPDGWGNHPRARNAHCFRLFRHDTRTALTIVQLHGLRDPAGKHDTPERLAQAHALVALIGATRQEGDGLIVCGDLNLLPQSETFSILAGIGLADLVTGGGFADTRTSWYGKAQRHADYLLVTADLTVRRFEVVESPEVSDHRALFLEID